MSTIADEKYVSFTTFKKDGTPKPTPVWIADLGNGTMGFTTSSSSWKVKRLANNPRVEVQPSDSKGKVTSGTSPVAGTAVVVEGAEFDQAVAVLKKKYGVMYFMMTSVVGNIAKLIGKGSGTDRAIVITLDDASS